MLRASSVENANKKESEKKRAPLSIVMKRRNDRRNEVVQNTTSVDTTPKFYGDRFIPRRYFGLPEIDNENIRAKSIHQDVMRMKIRKGYWRRYKMDKMLCDVFDLKINPVKSSVLKFSDNFSQNDILREPQDHNPFRQDWACKPRNRPLAFLEAVHDLPSLKRTGRQLIDWSAKNEIVAILSNKLVIWQLFTEKTIAYLMQETKAVVYDSTGNYLALATRCFGHATIYIWDTSVQDKRYKLHSEQLDQSPLLKYDEVSCMAWNAGLKIYCGTFEGTIFVFDFADRKIKGICKNVHNGVIVSIKFSFKYRYLASCDDRYTLRIWYCEGIHLEPKFTINRTSPIYFDFHPWKVHEMVFSCQKPTEITIFNIATQKPVALYKQYCGLQNTKIHAVSFCKKSAELLVSLWLKAEERSKILVLSAMDQVVDVLESHEEPVHHLVWSPDGKVLGTASEDQTFVLWNFFGLPGIEDSMSLRRRNNLPAGKPKSKNWTYEEKSVFKVSIR